MVWSVQSGLTAKSTETIKVEGTSLVLFYNNENTTLSPKVFKVVFF